MRYIVVNLNDKDQVLDDASGYGYKSISAAQALYVDDYYEALNEAAKEGFTVMTVQELMLRQYTAEQ